MTYVCLVRSQTGPVTNMASDFIASLLSWNYRPVEVKKVGETSIADVVATEFPPAISTLG